MEENKVAFKICKEYNTEKIANCLEDAFLLLGGLEQYIKPKMTVLIKPDLYLSSTPNSAKTTHPTVVSAVAELVAKCGATCVIADSPYGEFSQSKLDSTYVKTEMLNASNDGNATLNINDKVCVFPYEKGVITKSFYFIDAINDIDLIINVGKFRCDKFLGLVGCSQNLFGLTVGKMKNLIKTKCYTQDKFYNYILDTYEALEDKIVLNVLDGIVSCETNNLPRILNSIIVSPNPMTADALALKLINQSPEDSKLLQIANDRNLFSFNYEILGDNYEPLIISDYTYQLNPNTILRGNENKLFKSYLKHYKQISISPSECKGCKKCTHYCPVKAINMVGECAKVDYKKCINCFKCVDKCPYKVIKIKNPLRFKIIEENLNKNLKSK